MTIFPFGLTLIPRAAGPSVCSLADFLGSRRSGKTETWPSYDRVVALAVRPRMTVIPRAFYETHAEVR